ncbi:hypothetical protein [Limosilactobacillus gastricus]|uniref:hypothetical protein n=1 Tax=Limosilactobacillus gastricus TaxID=227942 RepID=UPI0026F2DFA0|nr:hypothetical protein [Limosilactobacillus gastricus]
MRQLKTSLLDRSANYLVNRFNNFFSSADEEAAPLHHNFYQLKDHELTYLFSSKQISYINFSQK